MISNLDIWRAATLLIRQKRQDAEIVAARRVDELAEREDHEGRAVWLRIRRAIVELQAAPAGPGHYVSAEDSVFHPATVGQNGDIAALKANSAPCRHR